MAARGSEATGAPVPPHRFVTSGNGTCADKVRLFPPFSSTFALLLLMGVLVGIVLVSLATFHFHKRKLRNRKMQRAHEEYERDTRSAARASGGPARPCVIVRAVRREEEEEPKPGSDDVTTELEEALCS